MALKRKRSSPAFSSPLSTTSATTAETSYSPLPLFYQQSKPVDALHQKPTWSFPTYDDSPSTPHLNSRTRKRHRDDRPDEAQVYASTINRLYEAQRRHPDAVPVASHTSFTQQPPAMQQHPGPIQKSTLHSFWNIKAQQPTATTVPMHVDPAMASVTSLHAKCEDCDRPLRIEDVMDLDDQVLESETACNECGRHVCDACSITGNQRVCLGCASHGK